MKWDYIVSKKSELEHLDAKQLVRSDMAKVLWHRKKKNSCTRPCTTVKKMCAHLRRCSGPEWTNNQRSLTVGLNNVFAAMQWITMFLTFIFVLGRVFIKLFVHSSIGYSHFHILNWSQPLVIQPSTELDIPLEASFNSVTFSTISSKTWPILKIIWSNLLIRKDDAQFRVSNQY